MRRGAGRHYHARDSGYPDGNARGLVSWGCRGRCKKSPCIYIANFISGNIISPVQLGGFLRGRMPDASRRGAWWSEKKLGK